MSVAVDSCKKSPIVYINNELCRPRKISITDMTLPYSFPYPSVVVYNDELHVLGLYHLKWDGTEWVEVSTMPVNENGCAVVFNGEIHYFTATAHYGWDGTQWNTYTLPNVSMENGHCIVLNNILHILGGTNNPIMHYRWDGTEWVQASTLPINFVDGSVIVHNGNIHILSGTSHYSWDGSSWGAVSTIPVSFINGDAVSLDKIYLIGCGEDNSQTYVWDGQNWTEDTELAIPLINGKAVVYEGSIYCVGGKGYFKMCIKYGEDILIGSVDIT